ncbi:MAG: hypothetical protein AAFP04_02065 [Myxococcota bacterium]
MNERTVSGLSLGVGIPFTVYSMMVIVEHGYLGFLSLAIRESWAMQMLLDIVIACGALCAFVRADARRRGIASWPFLVATLFLGSIAPLAYYAARPWLGSRQREAVSAT